jgi:hypothetical protein
MRLLFARVWTEELGGGNPDAYALVIAGVAVLLVLGKFFLWDVIEDFFNQKVIERIPDEPGPLP